MRHSYQEDNPRNEGHSFEDYLQPLMTFREYQDLSKRTAGQHNGQLDEIQNWTLGLSGEAGEVANLIKKAIFHSHGFDYDGLVSELGDVLWYLAQLCTSLGLSLDTVAEENLKKLARRYPSGFSAEDSINRTE